MRSRTAYAGLAAGTVVGTSTYLDVSVCDARLEIGSTAYAPGLWGTAMNPDTKLALLTHAFEVLGAGRVQLKTDVRNTRSQQAIARLGARYEGTLRRTSAEPTGACATPSCSPSPPRTGRRCEPRWSTGSPPP